VSVRVSLICDFVDGDADPKSMVVHLLSSAGVCWTGYSACLFRAVRL